MKYSTPLDFYRKKINVHRRDRGWLQFSAKKSSSAFEPLAAINNFHRPIFVSGCQRSGTTLVRRIIAQADEIEDFWDGKSDDELHGANILCGEMSFHTNRRSVFQTTYLNEYYPAYIDAYESRKLVWVIRNPYSVVTSMVYNWRRYALNELFLCCGIGFLPEPYKERYERFGIYAVPPLVRACASYSAKLSQLKFLEERMASNHLLKVEYDDIVNDKDNTMQTIYDFCELKWNPVFNRSVSNGSIKKKEMLTEKEKRIIKSMCCEKYNQVEI